MDPRGVFCVSIVCLAVVVAVASEPGAGHSEGAASGGQETTLRAAAVDGIGGMNTTASRASPLQVVGRGHLPVPQGERERVETVEHSPQKPGEERKDYGGGKESENEYEDEYEDELKAVAESHEAMSRDDTKNSNASTTASFAAADGVADAAKNFDSHEVITVNDSDEDIASNEAITDELDDGSLVYDREVAELLKYKKQRNANLVGDGRTKTKRVPTVKKELSTQREILIGSNETQVPKSLIPSEDTLNRLNEETEAVRRRNVGSSGTKELEDTTYSGRSSSEGEVAGDNQYSESEPESTKKLDKRQETDLEYLEDLKTFLTKAAVEEKGRQKILKPGVDEDHPRENVQKLLAKLLDQVDHMERMQNFIVNVKNQLANLSSRDVQEPSKKGYKASTLFSDSANDSRKSQKKFKRKRKKLRSRFSTTTLTSVPSTSPLLTTTETPWQTTPVQWRLVAERLFGPPWQQDLQEQPEKLTNSRALPSMRDLIEQDKSKSSSKPYGFERKPSLTENGGDFGNQRLLRFGNVGGRQSHRGFASNYERPADPGGMPDYDVAEAYHRLRYNQMPPPSREFLRNQEEDYQNDFMQDGFAHGQNYDPGRDFALSKSWPDISYKYNPFWNTEERPLLPMASEKWSWRRPQDGKYWPQRSKLRPVDSSYWLGNEEEREEAAEAEKLWQQRAQYSWDRDRSPWPMEKPLKESPSWQQNERPAKSYEHEQSNVPGVWEKSNDRQELNKSSSKQETKEKVVLPQITMKTWNSLTSDPATWPHKLPGAKPWPKDENGKSYNPNADLVKKLGLDKQNGGWTKEEAEKPTVEKKPKDEKQDRIFSTKESSKEQDFAKASNGDRSKSWSKLAESKVSKDWAKSEMQGDDANAWMRKYDAKGSWTNETALPKIQSVGAWVMSADQSTWKPYPIKPIESSDDGARRWSRPVGKSSTDVKWSSKGFWAEKTNDSGMDQSNLWPERANVADVWPGKSRKPDAWFSNVKPSNGWASKLSNSDAWKAKGGEWPAKENGGWSVRSNKSWTSKTSADVSKFNGESWPAKAKEEDSWKSGDSWPTERKPSELSPWQQKMSDEWNYGKTSSTGTWPSKWKQFVYHRVTAMPISKPGTTADASASKAKNAFVAVSAVSSPKYGGNEWRKNEDEARNKSARSSDDQERSGNQLPVGLERPIYAWKKDSELQTGSTKGNGTGDPLENELEALRQIDFWLYKENEAEKTLTTTTNASTETSATNPGNSTSTSTTTTAHRRPSIVLGNNGFLKTNRRTIPMK